MDASLGPGSAVRGNGKKRGEIAKKNKKQKTKKKISASEATISLSRTIPLASIRSPILHFTPFPLTAGPDPRLCWCTRCFLILIRRDTRWCNQIAQVKVKAAFSLSYIIVSRGDWLKAGKHQSWKQRCCSLCWKLPDRAQSRVFCSQIVTE